jgi:hypothetical protein
MEKKRTPERTPASRFRRTFSFREVSRRLLGRFPRPFRGWQERPGGGQDMGPARKAAPLCCAHQNRRGRWPRSIPPSTKARRQGAERRGRVGGGQRGGVGGWGGGGGGAKPCSRAASPFITSYYDGAGVKYEWLSDTPSQSGAPVWESTLRSFRCTTRYAALVFPPGAQKSKMEECHHV